MALELFSIVGKVALNGVDEAQRDLDETADRAGDASGRMSSAFKKIGGVIATVFAVDKIVNFGKQCVDAAAEVAAEEAAFAQIMGEYSDEAQAKIDEIADATGIANTRMKPYMTSMTAKFAGLGYGVEEATDLAQLGLTLAADAAAFWDKSLDDSMGALNSFINGSYEAGESIGLFANEATLAKWASDNLGMNWDELTEKDKQFARLMFAQAMQEASGVTGQAANEADAYANVQGNLTEAWRQFLAVIGEPILEKLVIPAMKKLTDWLNKLGRGMSKVISWCEENSETIKNWTAIIASAAAGVGAFLLVMNWGQIMSAAAAALNLVTSSIRKMGVAVASNPLGLIIGIIAAVITYLTYLYKTNDQFAAKVNEVWAKVKDFLLGVWESISPIFDAALQFISESIIPAISDFISSLGLFDGSARNSGSVFSSAMGTIKTVLSSLSETWSTIWPSLKTHMTSLFDSLQEKWELIGSVVFGLLSSIVEGISETWSEVWPHLQSLFSKVFDKLNEYWTKVGDIVFNALLDFVTWISETWSEVWPQLSELIVGFFEGLDEGWTQYGEPVFSALEKIVQAIADFWRQMWPEIQGLFVAAWDTMKVAWDEVGQPLFDLLKGVVEDVMGFVGQFFSDNMNEMDTTTNSTMSSMQTIISNTFTAIKGFWENVLQPVFAAIGTFIETVLKPIWDAVWPHLKQLVQDAFEVITTFWNESVLPTLEGISEFLAGVFTGDWEAAWNGIKQLAEGTWNGIVTVVKGAFTLIWDWLQLKLAALKVIWGLIWDAVSRKCSEIWTAIKTAITNAISNAYTTVVSKVTSIWTTITSRFDSIKTKVSTVWESVKTTITDAINSAKTAVSDAIDAIKGFFDFNFTWPNLPLPHFSISPAGWEIGDLLNGSIPSLGVEWYAKAMDNPMIMNDPTIFGYNPATGELMGGGEAGSEVVTGTNTLMQMISAAVDSKTRAQTEVIVSALTALTDAIVGGNDEMIRVLNAGQQIVLNGRELGRTVREYA